MSTRTSLVLLVALCFCSPCPELVSSKITGTEFVTAFLENLAYYHPSQPNNQLIITAISNNTQVTVTTSVENFTLSLQERETQQVALPPSLELQQSNISFKTVHVSSSLPITVLSVSTKANSTETSVVYPVSNLDTGYYIVCPPTPNMVRPFHFVVVNMGQNNSVIVTQGSNLTTWSLKPFENVQLYCTPSVTAEVKANSPVAVLFGHSCAGISQCNCKLAFEQLPSSGDWGTNFVVPPLPNINVVDNLFLLVSSKEQQNVLATSPASYANTETTLLTAVTLLGPGFLMNLLPEQRWSTNFLLHPLEGFTNYALLVAKTTEADGVQLGGGPLPASAEWAQVEGTEFSQTALELDPRSGQQIIWHPTCRIAVYYFGISNMLNASYGTPALSLNDIPGHLAPVWDQKKWTDALQHCESAGGQLVSISSPDMAARVRQALGGSATNGSAWIGLRQSVCTGQWYWLSEEPLNFTRWAADEPGLRYENKCAGVSLEPLRNFTWSTDSCCAARPFVCYVWGTQYSAS